MRNDKITNTSLHDLDWAQQDRARALQAMHSDALVRQAPAASSRCGTDVAGDDRRSVRAQLSGKGDARTTWWNVFSWAYMKMVPGADLERAMYAFHSMHHTITLARLGFSAAVLETAGDIERRGVIAAARRCVSKQFY
jgi:hypothetical protein